MNGYVDENKSIQKKTTQIKSSSIDIREASDLEETKHSAVSVKPIIYIYCPLF